MDDFVRLSADKLDAAYTAMIESAHDRADREQDLFKRAALKQEAREMETQRALVRRLVAQYMDTCVPQKVSETDEMRRLRKENDDLREALKLKTEEAQRMHAALSGMAAGLRAAMGDVGKQ